MAGEKKRKAELKPAASGAEDSYDDDEDEESEEEVEVCDQTVEERPARPVEGARAKFGSIVGPRGETGNAPDRRKENSRPSRKEEDRSRPPPEPKNPPKAPQEPPAEMSTDPKHGTSYCHICLKEVGGGESGRWQHVRSPAHLSYYLWSQNEEKRFGKSWYQCKSEAKAWADKLWQNSGQRAPSLGREDGKKEKKQRYEAPPPVPRADVEKWDKKDPPGGGSGDAGPSGGSKGRNDALILGLWQATLRQLDN